jgi:hypothetical protein
MAMESDETRRLIESAFDDAQSDHFIDRLAAGGAFCRLVDGVAGRPSARAALSQRGAGFADRIVRAVRARAREADDRVERGAQRLIRRQPGETPTREDREQRGRVV